MVMICDNVPKSKDLTVVKMVIVVRLAGLSVVHLTANLTGIFTTSQTKNGSK